MADSTSDDDVVHDEILLDELNDDKLSLEEITKKWEKHCNPYIEWLQSQPHLQWFVQKKNVSRMTEKIHQHNLSCFPSLSQPQLMNRTCRNWFFALKVYADVNGYSLTIKESS